MKTLLITIVPSILILLFFVFSDKFREPKKIIIITFLFGVLITIPAGYLNLAVPGSPLPIHGLATPGRASAASMMQDQNFIAYQNAIKGGRK